MQLSIVVPVFGCANCLPALYQRVCGNLSCRSYEIVFVDDASQDGAWPILKKLASDDPRVTAVRLSYNVGQHSAIAAGLTASRGERVVVMDCDLEHPPEWIDCLMARADRGFDIVLTRSSNRSVSWWREVASRTYFAIVRWRTGIPLLERPATFSLLSREAVNAYLDSPEAGRLYVLALVRLPFRMDVVDFPHQPRHSGRSAYSLWRLVRLFIRGVSMHSVRDHTSTYRVREMIQDGFPR